MNIKNILNQWMLEQFTDSPVFHLILAMLFIINLVFGIACMIYIHALINPFSVMLGCIVGYYMYQIINVIKNNL